MAKEDDFIDLRLLQKRIDDQEVQLKEARRRQDEMMLLAEAYGLQVANETAEKLDEAEKTLARLQEQIEAQRGRIAELEGLVRDLKEVLRARIAAEEATVKAAVKVAVKDAATDFQKQLDASGRSSALGWIVASVVGLGAAAVHWYPVIHQLVFGD